MPYCYNCGRHVDGPGENCRFCGWEYTDQWEEAAQPEVVVNRIHGQPGGCCSCCMPGCFWIFFLWLLIAYLLGQIWNWIF
ncbi:MAG: hypothetical protein CME22_07075 [Gemmatimonadetes bacterium]|jgi:predicted metal-binding protein|nr:hypothetical protein [Gemmatimonadota bacterium]